ncbi:serine/threonine protein kinase [Micromonospora sp. Llam0]|uniref:protein kinase domain-containing protein n=1 Tax=Micromonospora sp. Llam0 TaxID=2485143 RepID=UPI000F461D44|nr:protein kinase [Micromonospora sp. Llam0]ROO52210.1 serine/threonine protein kinase [Micromonospora sp. Llam0]
MKATDRAASITLSVVAGELSPRTFTVSGRTTCILGRANDCTPSVPDDESHRTVSRHHCLLDINPPDIRIRDFGSLNGTYVNGTKIGQREPGQTPEEGATGKYPEHDLSDGDTIGLGPTVIRVGVQAPVPDGNYLLGRRRCPICGRNVTDELKDRLCATCADDPEMVARRLVEFAQAGHPGLDVLSGYALVRELGRGGVGAVYLARHEVTGERIALKLMLPKVAVRSNARARFMREAALARSLHHPNIVNSYGASVAAGAFCFISEYCASGSLGEYLDRSGGRIPAYDAVRFTVQVLNGLAHAHRNGVVHRDLSIDNILLAKDSDGAVIAKIGDFGLAKAFDLAGLSGLTRTGATAGTPRYLPRQQVINFRYATSAVDVWAAAACLYRMLTGTSPRDFPADRDPWQVVLDHPPVPIRQRDASIPAVLAMVVDRALRDDPAIECQDAAELRDQLREVLLITT